MGSGCPKDPGLQGQSAVGHPAWGNHIAWLFWSGPQLTKQILAIHHLLKVQPFFKGRH